MTLHPRQPEARSTTPESPDALPPDTEASLIALDRQLRDLARLQPTPPGLVDRVYRASVGRLPQAVPATLPFRRSAADPRRTWWWGQVALAASLGLAFVLAGRVLLAPTPEGQNNPTMLAANSSPTDRMISDADLLTDDEIRLLMPESDVDYLLATRTLTMDELNGDVDRLYADLGM